ncbi:P1-P2 fusion protein [Soybean chlorotic leafroll virus]|uniref:P1-P2 fusion protein n=1 Tax=Soybean chlorotic leafroll virus TaxID=2959664 RepID=A0AAE9MDV6_9VIRU|nr:P1-P2 fusion protein [Soybean chlorotic leafroll virus]
MTTLKFVVLSFFCLFCFVVPTTMGSQELGLNFRPVQFGNITSPGWQTNWDSTYRVSMSTTPKSYSEYRTWSLPGENAIPTPTYKGVILDLWGLVSRDVKTLCLAVFENLDNFSRHTADSLMLGLKAMAREVCWIAIYVWYSALRSIIVTIWRTVRHNFTLVLSAALLGVFSMLLVKIVRWIFGQLPVYLVLTFLKTCRWIFRRLFWSKRARNYAEEKCCEQFLTFSISQDPPKRSQLVFQNEDGKHVGYGTCIRLFNGTNGLITAYHVASSAYKVVSTRNGNKIPLSAFKPLMVSPLYDQALYEGPCEWESLLGCKGVNFAPAKSLGACKCSIYKIGDDGKWECTNAEIEGQLKHHVMNEDTGEKRSALPGQLSVLSDTTRGQSGSGYFNGKTLVAIHVGGSLECEDEDASYNVAVPVLPKAGLTAPNYVFETTAPTSGVFDSHTIEKLTAAYDEALKFMKSKKASGKALWCDLEDDEFPYQVEGPQREKNNTPSKREARRRPRNNRKDRATPRKRGLRHPSQRYSDWGANHEYAGGADRQQYKPEGGRESLHQCDPRPGPEEAEPFIQTAIQQEERRQQWKHKARNYRLFFDSQYDWKLHSSAPEVPGFRACSKAPQWFHPKQKTECGWGEEVVRTHPEMGEKTHGFGWPQFGPQAELKSLRLQASRWLDRAQSAEVPSLQERERVIKRLVSSYKQAQSLNPVATMSGELLWDDFLQSFKEAVSSLQLDAGVGVPYVALGKPTHRSLVEDPQMLPVLARLTFDRLEKLSKGEVGRLTPEELVQNGYCDPIRVFVKGEPHKQSKLDEGRYRLIMSVSLVDQLVARVLFQEQNKREIALWRVVPSKPGFGLSTDKQVLEFTEALANKVGVTPHDLIANWQDHLVPTDCSGFDWSVADWMLDDDIEVRNRLTKGLTPVTALMRRNWKRCIANSVLCLSDGTLLAQTVPGVQKSGSYNTSSTNSRVRVMCAYHSGATWCVAMGDDALESVDSNLEEYKRLGLKVEVSAKLEFCSHVFETPSLATPVNVGKMLYKLIYGYNPGCGNLEVVANYLAACFSVFNELRHDPELVQKLYEWLVLPVQPQKNI